MFLLTSRFKLIISILYRSSDGKFDTILYSIRGELSVPHTADFAKKSFRDKTLSESNLLE